MVISVGEHSRFSLLECTEQVEQDNPKETCCTSTSNQTRKHTADAGSDWSRGERQTRSTASEGERPVGVGVLWACDIAASAGRQGGVAHSAVARTELNVDRGKVRDRATYTLGEGGGFEWVCTCL